MRCVLIDCARARLADIRGGGGIPLSLDDSLMEIKWAGTEALELVEIGVVMDRLDQADASTARVAELHYFAGFTLEECAELMNLSLRQVRHRWVKAKRWLREGLASRTPRKTPGRGRSAL